MPDFPNYGSFADHAEDSFISSSSALTGLFRGTPTSTAWPSANRAIFVPVRVSSRVMVYKMGIGAGATATGNFDVGIYDSQGVRLVSSGATAKGTSTEHILDVTDTRIGPGLYYLALAANGTNNYIMATAASVQFARLFGILQMASAYTLPTTATFAAVSAANIPFIIAYTRRF